MREELQCPRITRNGKIVGYGGNQEWFSGEFQRLAGCGSVTGSNLAAIYAASDENMKPLYDPKTDPYCKEEYLKLMETMYAYMKPGFMGYPLIGRFARDFVRYAGNRGILLSPEKLFLPKKKEQSLNFILGAIKAGDPVAFLILRHPARWLREDNWHWVTITGYDEENHTLIWSNCGEREVISWDQLFDPRLKYYVGMVRFQRFAEHKKKEGSLCTNWC
ncbi:MAG TPA: hypothetical protein H9754_06595 [Candidatus Anaerostipes avistercoris]|uniref:Uncharacterized protein n=1 Tax=Candidatus Anaerostipes avistercoris TaxID=2838462 RepID=A0A9D2PG66_9FIRM|nr:hypothetical protein [uncultured Anaerostipes sp.]HJC50230.1 hypothetical protein [Candidatus Anaerostipes avistercoris]